MTRLSFHRHFVLLAIASVVLVVLKLVPSQLLGENQFVLFGALHAMTVVGALRRPRPVLASGAFVIAGAILSVGAFYLGTFLGGLLGGDLAFYAMLGFASAVGASTYALVVRLLFLPQLPVSSVAIIAVGCVAATLAAVAVATAAQFNDIVLTLAWWWAFSGLLWSQATRRWHLTMRSSGP